MDAFLQEKDCMRSMVLVLDTTSVKTRSRILFLFALICHYSNEGLLLTLDAMNHYKLVKREKVRFSDLANSLEKITDADYRVCCITINY